MTFDLENLRSDATAKQLVAVLDGIITGLGNISGSGGDLRTYVQWAESTAQALFNVLSLGVGERWVYDEAHWRVREMLLAAGIDGTSVMGSSGSPAIGIALAYLRVDIDRRDRELASLRKRSEEAGRRWGSGNDLVVLDANLVMDTLGKPEASLMDLDWNKEINSRRDICLVIPLAVLQELDKLKRHNNKDVRSKARAAIRWLDQNISTEARTTLRQGSFTTNQSGSIVTSKVDALYVDLYVDPRARHTQDTDLTIIENAETIGKLSGCRSLVATRDINMRMRAQAFGVEAVKIIGRVIESQVEA